MSTQNTASLATPNGPSVSKASAEASNPDEQAQVQAEANEMLALPPSNPDNKNDDIKTLKMGESLKLDHLGPIILNTDGTTRRINNWDILTEHEREVTWRRIKKRNGERRKILEEQQKKQEEEQQKEL
jgi:hypothetical protein